MSREAVVKRAIVMFQCDTARIVSPMGRLFLIVGKNRNTRQDQGQWFKNGAPVNFAYVQEQIVASGDSLAELLRRAKEYKQLLSGRPAFVESAA